ncbi:MarR family winged helix-turn-helix transcriptional regulator [Streptomyces huiliensis]|uniref:MarR family winged helix-turn-helix transcriptional regulator n=1 Tax=Streptomyces huiliensis TaxID=2876027 RepID=UPI001CBC20ED|nr:MarR family transcriptional regulator [Streptomyces huiliensis]MBZ4322006.1 MarR family transcriptional regulator [Streptomyces huiliensis]
METSHRQLPDQEAEILRDPVDAIAAAWRRERPETPVASIGVVTRVWQLAKHFGDDRRRVLAEAGVDPATLDLLSVLRRSGSPYTLTTRQIAEQSLVTAGAISQRLNRAERDKLVTRRSAPGRSRAVLVELTPAGHDLLERTVDRVLSREAELLDGLTAQQRDTLTGLLRVLLDDVQRKLDVREVTHVGHP